jgi:phosphoserine phosphatase
MVEIIETYEELEGYDKVATLDMGGTLVEDGENIPTHAKINMAFGLSEEEEKDLYEEFAGDSGDLRDHVEHARRQTEVLRGRPDANIDVYADTVREIVGEREILDGAHEFVQRLDDRGYGTMVVSSAPPAVTLPFAEQLDVEMLYRWKDFEFTDEGYFDRVQVNEEASEGKHQVVEGLQELGVEVAHFGNGDNDKAAVRTADAGKRQGWMANPERAFDYAFQEARKL